MAVRLSFVLGLCAALGAGAQSGRFQINPGTAEGQLLQQAGDAGDEAKQLALYEDFLAKYPKHEGAVYAFSHAQPLWLKAKAYDKVIAAAAVVLAAEPDNPVTAYNGLQACEFKEDAACIIEWSGRTVEAAKKKLASKKPEDAEEADTWTRQVDYARQVITRCEYAFYAGVLKFREPKAIADLYEALEKMNAESQYIVPAGTRYFIALLQLNDTARAQAFAEKAAEAGRANEDMLLFAADANLSTTKDYDKAARYAAKLVETLPAQAAPPGLAAAEWEAKKSNTMARAWWTRGTALGAKEDWAACDQALRAGLAAIEASAAAKDLLPGAYFYLGLANYNLSKAAAKRDAARTADARKYFTACAKYPGPFQAPATKNLAAMAAGK
jgi:hypothetical protein